MNAGLRVYYWDLRRIIEPYLYNTQPFLFNDRNVVFVNFCTAKQAVDVFKVLEELVRLLIEQAVHRLLVID